VDLASGKITDLIQGLVIHAAPLPDVMIQILNEGGLISYFKKHGSFPSASRSR